jgi:uncharacterized paraquat-inducible protein A
MSSIQSLVLGILIFALATLLTTVAVMYLDQFLEWLRRRRGRR